jgi:serine/threonine protein kinase
MVQSHLDYSTEGKIFQLLILKALSADPKDRYQSAEEFIEDFSSKQAELKRVLEDEIGSVSDPERASKWPRPELRSSGAQTDNTTVGLKMRALLTLLSESLSGEWNAYKKDEGLESLPDSPLALALIFWLEEKQKLGVSLSDEIYL